MTVKNNDFGKTLIKITLLIDYHIKSQWCVAELFFAKNCFVKSANSSAMVNAV
jgi:hypothetical protein